MISFVLRWLIVIVLCTLTVLSIAPAVIGTIEANNLPIDLTPIAGAKSNLQEWARATTLPERVLWYVAGVVFFIAAVRLIRRTQAFWMWLIGFACLGARWALAQQNQDDGLLGSVRSISLQSFEPAALAGGGTSAQILFLFALLLIGIVIFFIDGVDREYWDAHGG